MAHLDASGRLGVHFRLTPEERDEMHARAALAGVSVQVFFEAKIFDRPFADERAHGGPRRVVNPQEHLPMTG